MKDGKTKNAVVAVLVVILGVLIAAGPQYLFHVCSETAMSTSPCIYTGKAEIGVGAVLAVLGLIALLSKNRDLNRGLYIGALLTSVLALLIVLVLIGVCSSSAMTCNKEALPGLTIVGAVAVVVSLAGIVVQSPKRGIER